VQINLGRVPAGADAVAMAADAAVAGAAVVDPARAAAVLAALADGVLAGVVLADAARADSGPMRWRSETGGPKAATFTTEIWCSA